MARTAAPQTGWLVKSEPDSFGINDLERDRKTRWDGVRNYQARNFLRAMQVGDPVLIYHSNCNPPSVVGLGTVPASGYPDPTQFEPSSDYFDPGATHAEPRWTAVDIGFVQRFALPLPRDVLRTIADWNDHVLFSRGRLSVMPVPVALLNATVAVGSGVNGATAAKKSPRKK